MKRGWSRTISAVMYVNTDSRDAVQFGNPAYRREVTHEALELQLREVAVQPWQHVQIMIFSFLQKMLGLCPKYFGFLLKSKN